MTTTPPPKHNHNPTPPSHTPTPSSHTPTTPPSHTPTPPLPDHFPALPLPIQQQFDRLQLSTAMQMESLASSFAQRIDQLISLYHASPPAPPTSYASSSHHTRPLTAIPIPNTPPPPPPPSFHTYIPPPEFGSFRGTPLRFDTAPGNTPEFGAFRGPQIRLDTPKFDGTDPAGWLYRIGEYFDFYATPHNDRLRLVGLCMEGQASDWFRWTRNNGLLHSWEDFVTQVQVRFDPDHFEDYVGALSKLRHTTTVSAYQSDFELLLNKVTGVSESTLVSVFISGLKPQLRRELNLRRPVTLTMAFALARELSALHADNGTTSQHQHPHHSSTHPAVTTASSHPNVPVHETTHQQHASSSLTRPELPIRRLSFAEKQAKDAQGLCYNCDQKWSRNHRCASRLLLLLGDNDEEKTTVVSTTPLDDDETTFSADLSYINSLYGTGHPRVLRVEGNILNAIVHVLIDGGSNHNFVHPRIVDKLRLPVTSIPPFRVYVGNGDSLPCSTQCTAVPLSMQGHSFEVDLYVLPVHGPDVLLGVQWLQMLGRVSHDYANLTMEFSWNGQQISLRGDHHSLPPISLHSIDHIHSHSPELHLEDKVVPQVGKDDTKQPKPNVDTQPVIHKGPTT